MLRREISLPFRSPNLSQRLAHCKPMIQFLLQISSTLKTIPLMLAFCTFPKLGDFFHQPFWKHCYQLFFEKWKSKEIVFKINSNFSMIRRFKSWTEVRPKWKLRQFSFFRLSWFPLPVEESYFPQVIISLSRNIPEDLNLSEQTIFNLPNSKFSLFWNGSHAIPL